MVDFNRDGMMDLVYPRIKPGRNAAADILVLINRLPAKDFKSKTLCNSKPTTEQPVFASEPALSTTLSSDFYVIAKVDLPSTTSTLAPSFGDWVPGRLRIADFEMDGFPDIVVTFKTTSSGTESQTFALAN